MLNTSIFFFSAIFSTDQRKIALFEPYLSSANTSDLAKAKIVSSVKDY